MKKKTPSVDVLKKLRQFRGRWSKHEGSDTAYGHLLLGPQANGDSPRPKKKKPAK